MHLANPPGQHGVGARPMSFRLEIPHYSPHSTHEYQRCCCIASTHSAVAPVQHCGGGTATLLNHQLDRALHRRRRGRSPCPPRDASSSPPQLTQHSSPPSSLAVGRQPLRLGCTAFTSAELAPQASLAEGAGHGGAGQGCGAAAGGVRETAGEWCLVPSPWTHWPPQPGTVQDQSSCALLLIPPSSQQGQQQQQWRRQQQQHLSAHDCAAAVAADAAPMLPRRRQKRQQSPVHAAGSCVEVDSGSACSRRAGDGNTDSHLLRTLHAATTEAAEAAATQCWPAQAAAAGAAATCQAVLVPLWEDVRVEKAVAWLDSRAGYQPQQEQQACGRIDTWELPAGSSPPPLPQLKPHPQPKPKLQCEQRQRRKCRRQRRLRLRLRWPFQSFALCGRCKDRQARPGQLWRRRWRGGVVDGRPGGGDAPPWRAEEAGVGVGAAAVPDDEALLPGGAGNGVTGRRNHTAAAAEAHAGAEATLPGLAVPEATSDALLRSAPAPPAMERTAAVRSVAAAMPSVTPAAATLLPGPKPPTAAYKGLWSSSTSVSGGSVGSCRSSSSSGLASGISDTGDAARKPCSSAVTGTKATATTNAAKLTRVITRCRTWRELQTAVHAYGLARMNAVHVSAALTVLSRMQLSLLRQPPTPWNPLTYSDSPSGNGGGGGGGGGGAGAAAGEAAAAAAREELQALIAGLLGAFHRHLLATWSAAAATTTTTSSTTTTPPGSSSSSSSSSSIDVANHRSSELLEAAGGNIPLAAAGAAASAAAVATGIGPSSSPAPAVPTQQGMPSECPGLGPRQLVNGLAVLARLRAARWADAGPGGSSSGSSREVVGLAVAAAAACWRLEEAFPPQELTTLLSSVAKLGYRPSPSWMEAVCAAVSAAAAAGRLSPRQLATALWSLATLRYRPSPTFMNTWLRASAIAMPYFNAYDVSQALWSLATLHRPSAMTSATHGLPKAWVNAALARAAAVLRPGAAATPQDVCNTLWAVARLQLAPPPAWSASVAATLLTAPYGTLQRCRPYDIASLMWAVATLLCRTPPPAAQLHRLTDVAADLAAAGRLSEQDLGNVLWSLGVLRLLPDRRVLGALCAGLAGAAARGQAGPQVVATAVWFLARLRLRPDRRLLLSLLTSASRCAAAAAATAAGDGEAQSGVKVVAFGSHSAALLLYGLARLKHLDCLPLSLDLVGDATELSPPPSPPPSATTTAAAAATGQSLSAALPPPPSWLRPILNAALHGLTAAGFEASNAGAAAGNVVAGGGGGSPQRTLPVLLWSVARLGYRPEESWVRCVLVHSVELLPLLSLAETCLVVSALRWLRCRPPQLWLQRVQQLLRTRWLPAQQEAARALAEAEAELLRLQQPAAEAGQHPTPPMPTPMQGSLIHGGLSLCRPRQSDLLRQQQQQQRHQEHLQQDGRQGRHQEGQQERPQQLQLAELTLQALHDWEERLQREVFWRRGREVHLRTSLHRLRLGLRALHAREDPPGPQQRQRQRHQAGGSNQSSSGNNRRRYRAAAVGTATTTTQRIGGAGRRVKGKAEGSSKRLSHAVIAPSEEQGTGSGRNRL
ncbi:hypothetical protein Agub_g1164 [Astrephomene gubernaculifera]|uniref:RAP domain-containing protein n=1 Tax=Astrephomene gubernaculifera TaxID=47775 RepID=A0AAD3DG07_9CHLO|nr:hypothetical protein Agub_g1164 [Astrephomene gubernaculifera]